MTTQPETPEHQHEAAPSQGGILIPMSGRAIVQVLAFLLGGALSGGGVSWATAGQDPTPAVKELSAAISALEKAQNEMKGDLGGRLAAMATSAAADRALVSKDLEAAGRERAEQAERLKDHEERLRRLERGARAR